MRDRVTEELNAYLKAEEEYLEKLPKCTCCGEPIQDDFLYYINGETLCEDCMNNNYRDVTENFMDN